MNWPFFRVSLWRYFCGHWAVFFSIGTGVTQGIGYNRESKCERCK